MVKNLKKPVEVFIAFGCNIGDCERQIETALSLVQKEIYIKRVSPIFKSKPYGVENQPDFHNGVFYGYTKLKPFELLRFLKEIEKKVGRKPRCRWCEREIDLDILYYGNLKLNFEELTIPHRDRINRDFVLKPLAALRADFVDPVLKKTAKEIIKRWLKK